MPEKMEPGNPSLVSVMFLNNALKVLLSTGMDRIQEHARQLSARIAAGLERLGHTVITPGQSAARSGNTCFLSDEAGAIRDHLRSRNILVWGELGRVRISGHLYNGSRDVDRLLAALAEI
jgi:selenocysteine lyase/cysteine desulfurase